MKKLLLMLVACMATMTAFAGDEGEGWSKGFTPVADKADLAGIHTAVAGDGSVYASSTYDQAFQFAGKAVTDPDGLLSSCVLKYDAQGNEQWAVSLVGKCKIHAMVADADGTLYIAGQSQDEKVVCTGTNGATKEILNVPANPWVGDPQLGYSAFIAKISQEGVIEALKVFSPLTEETVATSEYPMYLADDQVPISITPYQIKLHGDKLYMSASYKGNLREGNDMTVWEGAYVTAFDGMLYLDNNSMGLLSVNKSDLTGTYYTAQIQMANNKVSDKQYYPEAINFFFKDNDPVVVFIGFGDLYMHGQTFGRNYSFDVTDDGSGNKAHPIVFANTNNQYDICIFNAAMHDRDAVPYNLLGCDLVGDNLYLAGTFYGNFPLDNTVTKDKNVSFVSSHRISGLELPTVNWAKANEVESVAQCMIVAGEEVHAATADAHYVFRASDGDLEDYENLGFNDASCYNDQYCSTIFTIENEVIVFSPKLKPSSINEMQALKNGAVKYYNVNGMELSAPQKGLNIIKTAEGTIKVMK